MSFVKELILKENFFFSNDLRILMSASIICFNFFSSKLSSLAIALPKRLEHFLTEAASVLFIMIPHSWRSILTDIIVSLYFFALSFIAVMEKIFAKESAFKTKEELLEELKRVEDIVSGRKKYLFYLNNKMISPLKLFLFFN